MNQRDEKIVAYLRHFRIMSRDQLATLVASDNSNPPAIVNRVAKRLVREGAILQVPRTKDKTYLYASNPPMIHTQSSKINHYLGLAEIYIRLGAPEKFDIEVKIADDFITDAVTELKGTPVLIELQRSVVSNRKMQDKVDKFVAHYNKHRARHLWIFTDKPYDLSVPSGFLVEQKKMTLLK